MRCGGISSVIRQQRSVLHYCYAADLSRRVKSQNYHPPLRSLLNLLGQRIIAHLVSRVSGARQLSLTLVETNMPSSSDATPPTHIATTPVMRQYLENKREHPDAILFFRMGDFYEMFFEDALTASKVLELSLTSRSRDTSGSPIPMCGVPHHAVDTYVTRLVKRGFRVALCEQVEAPNKTKKLVRREVVRVISPGTLTDAGYLESREPAYLIAIVKHQPSGQRAKRGSPDLQLQTVFGIALIDVSTGEFSTAEYTGDGSKEAIADEIELLRPRELVLSADLTLSESLPGVAIANIPTTVLDPWVFGHDRARKALADQLQTISLEGFGLTQHPAATMAAGALVQYLQDTQKADLTHIRRIAFRARADHVLIDPVTFKHLEIIVGNDGDRQGSLLDEIDHTVTAMGGRLLRAWLQRPLHTTEPIHNRLDAVEEFAFRTIERTKLQEKLQSVHDLERLVARIALRTAGPRDLVSLKQSIATIPLVRELLKEFQAPLISSLLGKLDDVEDVRDAIAETLVDDPPVLVRDGGCIRNGVDAEIDELRSISQNAKHRIAAMESAERRRTGIASLKVRYNRVFGYYIEVSKSNLHAVPDDYHRKQTISSGERFITEALKEHEQKALGADERLLEREQLLFDQLRQQVSTEATRMQASAGSLASLDVLAGLAETAGLSNYIKPQIHDGDELMIVEGRHPVVERTCQDQFVPNDVELNGTTQQLVILTGPNMGGKSTYLRQTALIVLLAHAGSFVPATRAKIPIIDRVFARVGASDNIARGQSTFMLEMQETAKILHTATSRSLVLLDEIGRGTATFDGLSLAWAVAEHLATNPRAQPKTLFATHYHELTDLADGILVVANYHLAAKEWKDEIVFLRRVESGRSDRSYGIQVARLAGLPTETVHRAKEILQGLERDELSRGGRPSFSGDTTSSNNQLGLFQSPPSSYSRIAEQLRETNIDRLTPVDALTLLERLKGELEPPD